LGIVVPDEAAAEFIANVFRGFVELGAAIEGNPDLLHRPSPWAVMSVVLGSPGKEADYSRYAVRFGATSGSLMEFLTRPVAAHAADDRPKLLTYILGHVLLNAILRFPGPILSLRALAAYLATTEDGADVARKLFTEAAYAGPFHGVAKGFYWADLVDRVLDECGRDLDAVDGDRTLGEVNRAAVEGKLGVPLPSHECEICGGIRGGYYCPFTDRTVCQRTDCSVASNSWLPQGARLCRVRREFFDEWAPIIGL
jgi:hypothetical protein